MTSAIEIVDLQFEKSPDTLGGRFYKNLGDGNEISIEYCLGGFDVALYDKNLDLIGKKVCTNIQSTNQTELFMCGLRKAIIIANELLENYEP